VKKTGSGVQREKGSRAGRKRRELQDKKIPLPPPFVKGERGGFVFPVA
jgi:hypothetical protein